MSPTVSSVMRFSLTNIGILSVAHFGVALLILALEVELKVVGYAFLLPSWLLGGDVVWLGNGLPS